ncbi:hypothetical protein CMUS01_09131 [Colletotrichum musicola]|uniref:Clr5 domain-containing protein n=1 Tax=Colletotrichum musicola TaxID=2175873 RepID=A0A8H6NBC5_9PEZI|nr:hypothetical protein CMUS01_09131 [Colletotrichum musicola]
MAATRNLTTYRTLLESLYVEQDLKMRQVMKYMEREHAIVAGRSTYERLFKRWGLRKDTKRRAGSESTGTPEEAYRVKTSERTWKFFERKATYSSPYHTDRVPTDSQPKRHGFEALRPSGIYQPSKPHGYRIETIASSTPMATPVPDIRLSEDRSIPSELGALNALDKPVALTHKTMFVETL